MYDQRDLSLGGLVALHEHSVGPNRYDDRGDHRGSADDFSPDAVLLVGAEATPSRERRTRAITKNYVPIKSLARPHTAEKPPMNPTVYPLSHSLLFVAWGRATSVAVRYATKPHMDHQQHPG
jgi:hypothetical protein